MTATQDLDLIVVDRKSCRIRHSWAAKTSRVLKSFDAVCAQVRETSRDQVWIAMHEESASWLSKALASRQAVGAHARLLLFCTVSPEVLSTLYSGFWAVIPATQAHLPHDELLEVLHADHPGDYCIAAAHHAAEDQLVLSRGDFTIVVVSLDELRAMDPHDTLDPEQLAILDNGQTIALGDYELSFDAILHERDPKYRRRANARRRDMDKSFGGCLRRLRLLKRVPRSGFRGLSEKTIARLERGEVSTPHERTLTRIASRLGVEPDDILSY